MSNQKLVILQISSVALASILSIIYISLDFYYYFHPNDFILFNYSNFPYLLLFGLFYLSLISILLFFTISFLFTNFLGFPSISRSSLLVSLWVFFIIVSISAASYFMNPILTLGLFISIGIFFFIIQAYQGLEELVYGFSTILLRHRSYNEELDLDGEMLKIGDHLILFIIGAIFIIFQGITFFPFFSDFFSKVIPELRLLFTNFSLEWIFDLFFIPFLELIYILTTYIINNLLLLVDIDFLSIISQVIKFITSLLVLFIFISPSVKELRFLWSSEYESPIYTTKALIEEYSAMKNKGAVRGFFVFNPIYRVRNEGRIFIACLGRVTFIFTLTTIFLYILEGVPFSLMSLTEISLSFIIGIILTLLAFKRILINRFF
ncbi:MAG: hypothetical protein ACFFAU_10245 [Candidatus Hodarchaeota archaeon]